MSVQTGWRLAGLEKSGDARCARVGTEGRAEQHDGLQCGPSWVVRRKRSSWWSGTSPWSAFPSEPEK